MKLGVVLPLDGSVSWLTEQTGTWGPWEEDGVLVWSLKFSHTSTQGLELRDSMLSGVGGVEAVFGIRKRGPGPRWTCDFMAHLLLKTSQQNSMFPFCLTLTLYQVFCWGPNLQSQTSVSSSEEISREDWVKPKVAAEYDKEQKRLCSMLWPGLLLLSGRGVQRLAQDHCLCWGPFYSQELTVEK